MLYEAVKTLCEEKKVSVKTLEKETGLSNGSISKWNNSSPSVDSAIAVAKYLGVTVEDLVAMTA